MDYLLDTNICIHFFKGQFGIKERIEKIGYEHFAISEITLAELIYGAEKSQKTERNMKVVEELADKIEILPNIELLESLWKRKSTPEINRKDHWRFRLVYWFNCNCE